MSRQIATNGSNRPPRAESSPPVLMRVENVSKRFSREVKASFRHTVNDILSQLVGGRLRGRPLRAHEFLALRDVSFDVRQGEAVAVIGDNGAGKSTLVKLLMGRMLPTSGRVETRGSMIALTVLGLGFDPVLNGRENIFLNAATLGLARRQTEAILDKIIEFAEIGEFIDAPVQSYSSGMRARLGYAVAAHVNPDILLLDEVLAVGDIHFRRKCRRHMKNYIESGGTIVLVTHDLQAVHTMCTRCLVLEHGRLVFDGSSVEGIHFYTESDGVEVEETGETVLKPIGPSGSAAAEASVVRAVEAVAIAPNAGMDKEMPRETPSRPVASELPKAAATVEASVPIDESAHREEGSEGVAAPTGGFVEPARIPTERSRGCDTIENTPGAADIRDHVPTQGGRDEAAYAVEEKLAGRIHHENDFVLESISIRPVHDVEIRSGGEIEVRLRYRSEQDIPRVTWGFTFCTEDGQTHICSVLAGVEGGNYSVRRGTGEFWCRIPRLPLRGGKYMLKAGVGDADSGAALVNIGWHNDLPVAFSVKSAVTARNSMHAIVGDLVVLDAVLCPPNSVEET